MVNGILVVAIFFKKIILAETWYKTYDQKLLAIVEAFKIWRHYLKSYKCKMLVFNNHNNLYHFMDT